MHRKVSGSPASLSAWPIQRRFPSIALKGTQNFPCSDSTEWYGRTNTGYEEARVSMHKETVKEFRVSTDWIPRKLVLRMTNRVFQRWIVYLHASFLPSKMHVTFKLRLYVFELNRGFKLMRTKRRFFKVRICRVSTESLPIEAYSI